MCIKNSVVEKLMIFIVAVMSFSLAGSQEERRMIVFNENHQQNPLKGSSRLPVGFCPGDYIPSNHRLMKKVQSSPEAITRWTEWMIKQNSLLSGEVKKERWAKEDSWVKAHNHYAQTVEMYHGLTRQINMLKQHNGLLRQWAIEAAQELLRYNDDNYVDNQVVTCSALVQRVAALQNINDLSAQTQACQIELLKRHVGQLEKENCALILHLEELKHIFFLEWNALAREYNALAQKAELLAVSEEKYFLSSQDRLNLSCKYFADKKWAEGLLELERRNCAQMKTTINNKEEIIKQLQRRCSDLLGRSMSAWNTINDKEETIENLESRNSGLFAQNMSEWKRAVLFTSCMWIAAIIMYTLWTDPDFVSACHDNISKQSASFIPRHSAFLFGNA